MATAILLYNGLHFPIAMIDQAIAWSQKTGGDIIALFVLSDREQEEGYPFPNDLEETGGINTDNDAVGTDLAIIASNIRLMRHQSAIAKVTLQTQILPGPSKAAMHNWLAKATQVFVTEQPIDPSLLSIDPLKIKTALKQISAAIEWIAAD